MPRVIGSCTGSWGSRPSLTKTQQEDEREREDLSGLARAYEPFLRKLEVEFGVVAESWPSPCSPRVKNDWRRKAKIAERFDSLAPAVPLPSYTDRRKHRRRMLGRCRCHCDKLLGAPSLAHEATRGIGARRLFRTAFGGDAEVDAIHGRPNDGAEAAYVRRPGSAREARLRASRPNDPPSVASAIWRSAFQRLGDDLRQSNVKLRRRQARVRRSLLIFDRSRKLAIVADVTMTDDVVVPNANRQRQ